MEVILADDDDGSVFGDFLFLIAPFASELNRSFPRLDATVSGQHALVAEVLSHVLTEGTERVVVESARSESQTFGLLDHRVHDFRMAVALVHGGIGGQKIHVPFAFGIPKVNAFPSGQDGWNRMVIVGAETLLQIHGLGAGYCSFHKSP